MCGTLLTNKVFSGVSLDCIYFFILGKSELSHLRKAVVNSGDDVSYI